MINPLDENPVSAAGFVLFMLCASPWLCYVVDLYVLLNKLSGSFWSCFCEIWFSFMYLGDFNQSIEMDFFHVLFSTFGVIEWKDLIFCSDSSKIVVALCHILQKCTIFEGSDMHPSIF